MRTAAVSGTEGYADDAAKLFHYDRELTTAVVLAPVLHLIPDAPCDLMDIGSGTGRDAVHFAAQGYSVVAVEPTADLREGAKRRHAGTAVEWVDDGLPDLASLQGRGPTFDAILLTAVWMHLDAGQRRRAMAAVAGLRRAGGVITMSLRHGPVPAGRRMFDVSGEETIALAAGHGLRPLVHERRASVMAWKTDVTWTWLAFGDG